MCLIPSRMKPRGLPVHASRPLLTLSRIGAILALAAFAASGIAQDVKPEDKPPAPPDAPAPPPAPAEAPPAPRRAAPPHPPDLGPPNPPADRQGMWPSPTAEDWKKPVLIPFQRTWDDAVAVSKETGKRILVCVNMDGEIASEHYAGIRYREPEISKMYEPYVCVIASVYRHSPQDYDGEGRRILCPRFGSVTCGEHIAIEPGLFEKFFDGQRVAPRHVAVDLEGRETYDIYYINDVASVLKTVKEGAGPPVPPVVRGDRPIADRVASNDAADR